MRWWREWRNPELKCTRVGHSVEIQRRKGTVKNDGFRSVAKKIEVEQIICARCGLVFVPEYEVQFLTSYTSFAAPSEMMDDFRAGEMLPDTRWETIVE